MTRKNGEIILSDTIIVDSMENRGNDGPSMDLANVAG